MSQTPPALNVPSVGFMRLSQVLKIIPVGKTLWYLVDIARMLVLAADGDPETVNALLEGEGHE